MASHSGGGGHSPPEPAGVGRGRGRGGAVAASATVGRGATPNKLSASSRGRGLRPTSPRSPGSPRTVPPPASSVPATNDQPQRVKVHISSLSGDVNVNDITEYFTNFSEFACEGDIKVSSTVILGGGKADVVLNGLIGSDLQELAKDPHKIKGNQIITEFEPLPANLAVGPVRVEVGNVPRTLSMGALKTYFESHRSGGSDGAVTNIKSIDEGVFHVTFEDQNVAARVMSETRTVKSSVLKMRVLEEDEGDGEEEMEGEEEEENGEKEEDEEEVVTPDESDFNQIKVWNFPDGVSDRVVKTYFETKRANSSKGAVCNCLEVKKGVFVVTFYDSRVAVNVLSKQEHVYKGVTLKLTKKLDDGSGAFNQIVVRNVPEGLSERILKKYFETTMANSCDNAVSDCKQVSNGVFVVTFHDPNVAMKVLSKQPHVYKGTTLTVSWVNQSQYRRDQLLVRGLQKGTEKEEYELTVTDRTEIPMEDFSISINDDSSAFITFLNTYSTKELQEIAGKLAARDAGVTVELVKDSKPSVHICNIMPSVSDKDILKVYFSKPEMSGGGEIESVTKPSESEAIVTFADPKVIQQVMKKDHKQFLGSSAIISIIGSNTPPVSPDSASIVPEPLEFSLDPLLIQSINQNRSALEQSVMSTQVQFSADEEKGMLVFSPTGKAQSSWRQECEKLVPQYLAQLTKRNISIPTEAATEAKEVLTSISRDNPSLQFDFNTDETEITVAGEDSCVEAAKKAISSLCTDLTTECTEHVLLSSPEDFAFLEQVRKYEFPPSITISFDADMLTMVVNGPKALITKIKTTINNIKSHAKVPVGVSPGIAEFFKTKIGQGKFQEVLQKVKFRAALFCTETFTLQLYLLADHKDEENVKVLAGQLQHTVTCQTVLIPNEIMSLVIDSEEFTKLCQSNENHFKVLIKYVGHELTIIGFIKNVKPCEEAFQAYFKEKLAPPTPIEIDIGSLAAQSIGQSPQGLEKCLREFDVKLSYDGERGTVQVAPSHYLRPAWQEECTRVVNEFKNEKIFECSMDVPEIASSEILGELLTAQRNDKTFVHVRPTPTSLLFAGSARTVMDVEQKIKHICSVHEYKHEELSLNAEMFEFINQVKLQSMKVKFRNVNVKLISQSSSISISGPAKEFEKVKEKLMSLKRKMVSIPVPVQEPILQYLISGKGRDQLLSLFVEKKCNKCITYGQPSPARLTVVCTRKHCNTAELMKNLIVERTLYQSIAVSEHLQPYLHGLQEFTSMMTSLAEEENSAIVSMEGRAIIVSGFKEGVSRVKKMISSIIEEKVDQFTPLEIEVDRMTGLYLQDNMESLTSWALSVHVKSNLIVKKAAAKVFLSPTKGTKPEWKNKCKELFLSFVDSEFRSTSISFPEEVKHEVIDLLISRNKDIRFDMNADNLCATIAGERKTVEEVLNQINDIQHEKIVSKSMKMDVRKYEYFTQIIQDTISSQIELQLLPNKHSVTFTSCVSDVLGTCKLVEKALEFKLFPIFVEKNVVRFLNDEGYEQLRCLLQDRNIKAGIHINISVIPPTLELLCHEESITEVRKFCKEFKNLVSTSNFPLSKTATKPALSQKLEKYCQELKTKHHVLIEKVQKTIHICGFKSAVENVITLVEEFVRNNCVIDRTFNMEKGKAKLLSAHMKGRWEKFESDCRIAKLSITRSVECTKVEFKGDISEVERVIEELESLLESICTTSIPLETTQICRFFQEGGEGALKLPGIEQSSNVIIEVCAVVNTVEPTKITTPESIHRVSRQLSEECTAVVSNKQIRLYRGDITEFKADVIVNAANEDLKHIGGLAYSILRKGGKEIQDASDRYMKGRGKLQAGDVWLSTTVGNLPCQALIHAVGPRWQRNKSGREQLKKVCMNCLIEASSSKSIALPAISTGVFGCPMSQCADVMVSTAVEFCNTQTTATLEEINIILFKQPDVAQFVRAMKSYIPVQNLRCMSKTSSANLSPTSLRNPRRKPRIPVRGVKKEHSGGASNGSTTSLGCVSIKEGSLLDIQAEIYVNSTNGNLDLSGGAVAKAIAQAAGPELQTECTKKAPIGPGEIAVTGAGNITGCKCIIHVNCPEYQSGGQAEQMLKSIMKKCMEECCEKQSVSSIVFPAIGTGILKFPADTTARIMVGEICSYLRQNKCDSLKSVSIMIYKDRVMYKTFCDELESQKKEESVAIEVSVTEEKLTETGSTVSPLKKVPVLPPDPNHKEMAEGPIPMAVATPTATAIPMAVATPTATAIPMAVATPTATAIPISVATPTATASSNSISVLRFGNGISMEIIKGDITAENVDVIVNTTAEGMVLDGGVSLALAKKAGKKLQEACNAVPSAEKKSLKDGKIVVTESGDLKCKNVFHMKFRKHNFVSVVSACIEKARELKYSSIAFPAIGTGREGYPADASAKDMIKGMQKCGLGSMVNVRVVLFEAKVYQKFVEVVINHQTLLVEAGAVAAKPKASSKAVDYPTDGKLQPIIYENVSLKKHELEIQIFGETHKHVKSAESKINDMIKKQFIKEKIEEDKVGLLKESQLTMLKSQAQDMELKISIDLTSKIIELEGNKDAIYKMRLKVSDELSRAEKAEELIKRVQWKRQDSKETSYDSLVNLEIEEHREKSTYTVKDDLSGENFTIDFQNFTETDHNMEDRVQKVIRAEISAELPDYWASMRKEALHLVDLKTSNKEYKFVLGEFNKTMKQKYTTIFNIQRIQNPQLYKQFVAKKKQLESQNPPDVQNERWLFHGTKQSSIASINRTNFNRNFRGQNATVYGQGCYFARDASYSNGYAPPDAQGHKHMYLVRVLTGQYTRGRTEMLVPPAKDPSDQAVLYESVVNDTTTPTIFVVFYDADAYPEYLITYR